MVGFFVSTLTTGFLFAFAAMGVFISYRIFRIPDMTTDGSFLVGGAVTAILLLKGVHPIPATLLGGASGAGAGILTGILHTRWRINAIIAGIIVTSALYSISQFVMGAPSLGTTTATTLMSMAKNVTPTVLGTDRIFGMPAFKITQLVAASATALGFAFLLRAFFKRHFGLALRAAGDNERMITPLGVNVNVMLITGLAIANGFVAVSGGLFVQESGLASIDMGFGQLVGGLGAVLVGKVLMERKSFGWGIVGAVIGSVLYQVVIAAVLLLAPANFWSKFVTSAFLLGVLLIPDAIRRLRSQPVAAREGS